MNAADFKNNLYYLIYSDDYYKLSIINEPPQLLWMPQNLILHSNISQGSKVIIFAKSLVDISFTFPVLIADASNNYYINIDIEKLVKLILFEKYHSGLATTVEMKLPFNYSILPPLFKSFARKLKNRVSVHESLIDFPVNENPFIVDWLIKLNNICKNQNDLNWYPDQCKRAIVITHDADNEWIFKNDYWFDKIIGLENEFGYKGAWFCVPEKSSGRKGIQGIEKLITNGCEIGCHGYNHDAKFPFVKDDELSKRLSIIRSFVGRWSIKGFRSEWLWRSESFINELSGIFSYDSSIPSVSSSLAKISRNGCGTSFPFKTFGNLTELPLTLPMDVERHILNISAERFWEQQYRRTEQIITIGGMVNITLHPQPHQFANERSFKAFKNYLKRVESLPGLWKARPVELAEKFDATFKEQGL